MEVLSNTADGKAHGKIILIGEHAVVHNEPAIAIPFTSATVEVIIEKVLGESTMDSIYHYGKLSDAPKQIKNLIKQYREVQPRLTYTEARFLAKYEILHRLRYYRRVQRKYESTGKVIYIL